MESKIKVFRAEDAVTCPSTEGSLFNQWYPCDLSAFPVVSLLCIPPLDLERRVRDYLNGKLFFEKDVVISAYIRNDPYF